jgi:hypothetical protein
MDKISEEKRLADISVRELKELIRQTLYEIIDPDYRLELRAEIEDELKKSRESKERIPAEVVAERLGLKW